MRMELVQTPLLPLTGASLGAASAGERKDTKYRSLPAGHQILFQCRAVETGVHYSKAEECTTPRIGYQIGGGVLPDCILTAVYYTCRVHASHPFCKPMALSSLRSGQEWQQVTGKQLVHSTTSLFLAGLFLADCTTHHPCQYLF